jgi:hypothetical protein
MPYSLNRALRQRVVQAIKRACKKGGPQKWFAEYRSESEKFLKPNPTGDTFFHHKFKKSPANGGPRESIIKWLAAENDEQLEVPIPPGSSVFFAMKRFRGIACGYNCIPIPHAQEMSYISAFRSYYTLDLPPAPLPAKSPALAAQHQSNLEGHMSARLNERGIIRWIPA